MTHNKYAILNEEYHLNYKEEEELKKALQESKKMFDKKNKKQKEINDNQLLVARLNSELSNKREQDRHIDAALIDSEKMYKSEQDMSASKQMEEDRKLGLFGDYPEINSALHRNYNSLIKIENLRKNEVIPDDFIGISGGDKFK
jgi:ATP-dependent 26S proteasome regulatory subunit